MNRTEKKELILVGGYFLIFYLSFAMRYFFEWALGPCIISFSYFFEWTFGPCIISFSYFFSRAIENRMSGEKKFQLLIFSVAIIFFLVVNMTGFGIYMAITGGL